MKKKVFFIVLGIIAVLVAFNIKLLIYGVQQGIGQLEVILNARPISEILEDENEPDSLKDRLQFTLKARAYAIDVLGLKNSDNYTSFYDQKGKPILWNLSASLPYELEAYRWKFPFLGSVPYKGFFELERAKTERDKLKNKGYDTRIRQVSGWSTLGILNDPILSNMVQRGDGQLAEVIIHELVHATIFIKDDIVFNENLASFIGEIGAQDFLAAHFGDSSESLIEYLGQLEDSDKLKKHMLRASKSLDSLYTTIASEPDSIKQTFKEGAIQRIVDDLDTISFNNDRYYRIFEKVLPNNAYFMSNLRYFSKEDSLREILKKYDGNLSHMIDGLKKHYQ